MFYPISILYHLSIREWRFTLDFDITLIRPLFQRLGTRKPKYFAKVDLTAGYYEASLHEASCVYTAFRTIHGLYEWTRVPMGTTGSGFYFQRVIATQVFDGLIYLICELYIDDVLIDGADEDTFVNNVRQVFSRFRKHKITRRKQNLA